VETLFQDIRYGVRMLLKHPGFTSVALMTLALGIGANTAIFSVINAVLLRPLPYRDPDRLVTLWKAIPNKDIQEDWTSYPAFKDWGDQNHVFEDMALVFRPEAAEVVLTGTEEPRRMQAAKVSANFFPLLGVQPALGRGFSMEEGERGDPVVVLSQGFWQRHFGSSPDAIGKGLEIDGRNTLVVGIMPLRFQFPSKDTEVWLLNTADPRWPRFAVTRLADAFFGIGRLKPGITLGQAQAEMSTIARRLGQQYPDTDSGLGVKVVPLRFQITGDNLRLALWVLLGAVVFVLLIACVNVASLVLARGGARKKEFSLRAALGADRWRLIRQLLTESAVLSLLSGFLGLGLAAVGVRALVILGPVTIPRLEETGMDPGVLAFTGGISMLTGLLFGLAPAWRISLSDPDDSLKDGVRGASAGRGGSHTRRLLVVLEFALALVLLTGASLLVRSFLRVQGVDLGFRPGRVLMMHIGLPDLLYQDEPKRSVAFFEQAIEKVEALPGVEAAALGAVFGEHTPNVIIAVEGRPPGRPGEDQEQTTSEIISDGYFRVMGIPLLSGRFFSDQDRFNSPPVAIINQTMAHRFWPGEDPLGRRFKYGVPGEISDWRTVVGVVGDMLPYGPESRAISVCYLPFRQRAWVPSADFVVRTASDPLQLTSAVRSQIHSIDKTVPRFEITTVEQRLRELSSPRRFQTWLLALFSFVALMLAAIGIYGLMHLSVIQRTHEIGIRIAVGAGPGHIIWLVMREALGMVLLGLVLGLAGALALTRLLSSLLFGVTPTDPLTFVLVSLVLTGVALVASYLPARRAIKVDPVAALRCE
jgi:predicted permease